MRKGMKIALAVALAATLVMALQDDEGTVEPVKTAGASSKRGSASTTARAGTPGATDAAGNDRSNDRSNKAGTKTALGLADAVANWKGRPAIELKPAGQLKGWGPSLPPAPPPQKSIKRIAEAPPPPQAPRFPHAWVGRFNDMAVVSGPQQTWVMAAGDVIEGKWRIDRVDETQIQMTYLPLKQAQTVAMKTP